MKKLTLALLLAGMIGGVNAAEINYAYAMYGAQEIAPLQVFDDGSKIYMQMPAHRLAAPPVPFTDSGEPIPYEINGHYVTMPIHDRIVLRVGSTRAFLQSSRDAEGGNTRTANGVRGKNVWYGAAAPARITMAAPSPEPAVKVSQVPIKPPVVEEVKLAPLSVTTDAERKAPEMIKPAAKDTPAIEPKPAATTKTELAKSTALTGRFDVSAGGKGADEALLVSGSEVVLPVEGMMTTDDISRLSALKSITIEADGSAAGYRKAKSTQTMIRKTTTVKIKPVGAPAGHIRIVSGV